MFSLAEARAQVHVGLLNAGPAADRPKLASCVRPAAPLPNAPYIPSTRMRVPVWLKARKCRATAGMLTAQLAQPSATNHTSSGRPRKAASVALLPSRRVSAALEGAALLAVAGAALLAVAGAAALALASLPVPDGAGGVAPPKPVPPQAASPSASAAAARNPARLFVRTGPNPAARQGRDVL